MLVGHSVAPALAALIAGAFGVAALYASWRKRLQPKSVVIPAGWFLIALSFYLWMRVGGAEFGPVLAALQLSIVAWIFVLANRHVRRDNGRRQEPVSVQLPPFRAILRHAAIFLLAVPLAACSATLLTLAVSTLLPWNDVDRLAFSIVLMPLAWGALAYWACADSRLLRPALGLVAGGSLSVALLYI
ncbi:MAG: hypothetical protein ACREQ1_11805 [Woeseiaceae bacterium]